MPYSDTPAQNHHYGRRKGESVKQERMNLLKDNPVVRTAAGDRPWMSKHFKSTMSPLRDGHGESPAQGNAFTKAMADNDGDYEAAKKQLDGMSMKYDGPDMKYDGPDMKYGDGPGMHTPNHKNMMEDAGAATKMHTPMHNEEGMKMAKVKKNIKKKKAEDK